MWGWVSGPQPTPPLVLGGDGVGEPTCNPGQGFGAHPGDRRALRWAQVCVRVQRRSECVPGRVCLWEHVSGQCAHVRMCVPSSWRRKAWGWGLGTARGGAEGALAISWIPAPFHSGSEVTHSSGDRMSPQPNWVLAKACPPQPQPPALDGAGHTWAGQQDSQGLPS